MNEEHTSIARTVIAAMFARELLSKAEDMRDYETIPELAIELTDALLYGLEEPDEDNPSRTTAHHVD